MRFSSKLIIIGFVVLLTLIVGIKAVKTFDSLAENQQTKIDNAFNVLQ